MLISVFHKKNPFIGDHILLGILKHVDKALDLSIFSAKYFGSGADEEFILDDVLKC